MSEMKRPQVIYPANITDAAYFGLYYKSEADAYIAALERRARIAERAFDNEWLEIAPEVKAEKFAQAEREIDAELAKEKAR